MEARVSGDEKLQIHSSQGLKKYKTMPVIKNTNA